MGHLLANVKLENTMDPCALPHFWLSYYSWDEEDRLFQLRASLEGSAGQILWNASQTSPVKDII